VTGEMNERKSLPARTRVLLADDQATILHDIEELLTADFEIVGTVTDGVSAIEAAARLQPDLIVTDLAMPRLGGIEASREMLKARPGLPIVLLTMNDDPHLAEHAISVGIRGYVHKLTAGEELIPAAQCALRGETFISPTCRKS
jgi:DNA-binding NarL/FixJ family response regulator